MTEEYAKLTYSEIEKANAEAYCQIVIDELQDLSVKEKWLVIMTLYDSFPKEELKKYAEQDVI